VTLLPYLRRATLALAMIAASFFVLVFTGPGQSEAAPATNLTARITCQNDTLNIVFSWQSSRGNQQWLDLSVLDNGFAGGTFSSTGPIDGSAQSIEWTTAQPSSTYYARINTYDRGAWATSTTLTLNTPACGEPPAPPVPTGPAPNADMLALQASLEQEIAASGYTASVAVTDMQSGETISVNGARQQLAGCTVNLFVLMQAAIDVSNGLYPESAVGDLISATIYGSNPVTAHDILEIAGNGDVIATEQRVNGLIQQLGLTSTFYDHPPAYWPASSLRGMSNLTTALDMNKALVGFWNGSIMSTEWRDYLYEKMQGVKPGLNYLIPAGVSDGIVGHKNGFLWVPGGYVDNDTGIVTFERNGQTYAYAITFMTQGVVEKYADITLGQTVSSLVWQYFSNHYYQAY
jgi:beta-lactamase class A